MNICTYYTSVTDKPVKQEYEIINLWKLSWQAERFTTNILTEGQAKSHSFYEEFVKHIKDIHASVMDKSLTSYGLACWVRWLSYASLNNKNSFYVSDYDVINYNHKQQWLFKKLTFHNAHCPCIASGNSKQFEELCYLFIDLCKNNMDKIMAKKQQNNFNWFHDQEFIDVFYQILQDKYDIKILYYKNPRYIGCFPSLYGKQNCSALHFSNHAMQILKEQEVEYTNLSTNEIRSKHIKKVLGI